LVISTEQQNVIALPACRFCDGKPDAARSSSDDDKT